MPAKKRTAKVKAHRITPDAVAAYRAGDAMALHAALGLRPWQPSPLDVAGGNPYGPSSGWTASWELVTELRDVLDRNK